MPGSKAPEAVRREQILEAAYDVASRTGLQDTTIQEVAAEAGVSSGLVLFYFKSKRELLHALLDWLLASSSGEPRDRESCSGLAPAQQLFALLRREMDRLAGDRRRTRVMFDFSTAGVRDARIRAKLRIELRRLREELSPLSEALLAEDPARFAGVTAESLVALTASFIKGCAVQSLVEPDRFDAPALLRAAESLFAPARNGAAACS